MNLRFTLISDMVRRHCADRIISEPEIAGHEVVVRPHKSKRSLEQNDLMWALYREVAPEIGYSPEELHEVAKDAYGGHREVTVGGVTVNVLNFSTSGAKVDEMRLYLDWLAPWLAEHTGVDTKRIAAGYDV